MNKQKTEALKNIGLLELNKAKINNLNKNGLFIECFISNKNLNKYEDVILRYLKNKNILSNITNIKSIVFNKGSKKTEIEPGLKIDFLYTDLLEFNLFWMYCISRIQKLNCFWINIQKENKLIYQGCSCEHPFYKKICNKLNLYKFSCSEYN